MYGRTTILYLRGTYVQKIILNYLLLAAHELNLD